MLTLSFDRKASSKPLSRRNFLQVGALGALGLTLPEVLRAQAQAPAADQRRPRAQSVILVYLGGGLSHHDSFDMKPDQPEEIRGIYRPIATSVPGLQVS